MCMSALAQRNDVAHLWGRWEFTLSATCNGWGFLPTTAQAPTPHPTLELVTIIVHGKAPIKYKKYVNKRNISCLERKKRWKRRWKCPRSHLNPNLYRVAFTCGPLPEYVNLTYLSLQHGRSWVVRATLNTDVEATFPYIPRCCQRQHNLAVVKETKSILVNVYIGLYIEELDMHTTHQRVRSLEHGANLSLSQKKLSPKAPIQALGYKSSC